MSRARKVPASSEYPTLEELTEEVPVMICRDGAPVAVVASPNAAFVFLAKRGTRSVSWMLKHDGWSCREATPEEVATHGVSLQ